LIAVGSGLHHSPVNAPSALRLREPQASRFRAAALRALDGWIACDPRALGLFRVALGATILLDLARRVPVMELVYSGAESAVPPAREGLSYSWSLLSGAHPAWWAWTLLGLTFAAALGFTLGWRHRLTGALAWVGLLSFHSNRFGVETSASVVLRLALAYAVLLPADVAFAVRRRPGSAGPVRSLAVTGLLLQLAMIYLNAAAAKVGPSWTRGTALHDMLELDTFATPLGVWLRGPLADALSPYVATGTLVLELMGALLLLVPVGAGLIRAVVVPVLVTFHLYIAALLNVGLFSPAMISVLLLFLPAGLLDRLRIGPAPAGPGPQPRWAAEGVAAVLMLADTSLALRENMWLAPAAREAGLTPPEVVHEAARRLEIDQSWRLFAPNVQRVDRVLIVRALTAGGRDLDLITEAPPDFGPIAHNHPAGQFWAKLTERVGGDDTGDGAAALERHLVTRWNRRHPDDPVASAEVWLLAEQSPPPGEPAAPPQPTRLR
jgi:hypothetical protein